MFGWLQSAGKRIAHRTGLMEGLLAATKTFRYGWAQRTYARSGKDLSAWRNRWRDRTVVVVGNGPSLSRTPLEELAAPAIGLNKINLLFGRTSWRPSVIVCANGIVMQQNRRFYEETDIPLVLNWVHRRWAPKSRSGSVDFFLARPGIEFRSDDGHQGFGSGGTVTYTALQLAYLAGARRVILVGVDHSFKQGGQPHTIQERSGPDPDHFHPDYFADGELWKLPDLPKSELAYQLAKDAFERDGREIVDATIDGHLKVFRRVSIEQAKAYCE